MDDTRKGGGGLNNIFSTRVRETLVVNGVSVVGRWLPRKPYVRRTEPVSGTTRAVCAVVGADFSQRRGGGVRQRAGARTWSEEGGREARRKDDEDIIVHDRPRGAFVETAELYDGCGRWCRY